MSSDIFNGYINKKKKVLLDYSKTLEQIITLEANSLWKNTQSFSTICRGFLDTYVEVNYFDNNYNRDNPIEYLNDSINEVLLSIVDYFKMSNKPDIGTNNKSETLLLAIIISTASYIDVATNIVDGNYISLKNKFKALLSYLSKANYLKVYSNDKVSINRLFDKIKKHNNEEKKFFDSFDNIDCSNQYQIINKNLNYITVKLNYAVQGVDNYDQKLIEKINKLYNDKYLTISYDLLTLLLIKENLINKDVNTYLVPFSIPVNNRCLRKIDIPIIKEHIKLLFSLEKSKKNKDVINDLVNKGFNIIYYYDGTDGTLFDDKNNIEVLCNDKFFEKNMNGLEKWKDKGITFVENNVGPIISENTILNKKEEN